MRVYVLARFAYTGAEADIVAVYGPGELAQAKAAAWPQGARQRARLAWPDDVPEDPDMVRAWRGDLVWTVEQEVHPHIWTARLHRDGRDVREVAQIWVVPSHGLVSLADLVRQDGSRG